MRSFFIGIAAILLAASGTAPAQSSQGSGEAPAPRTYTQAQLWNRSAGRISFTLAGISLPIEAGATQLNRSAEASREGQGLDNALSYFSADEAVFATVYIYAPGLPDAGLTAFMTDHVIHLQSGADLRTLRNGIVAAGGRDGVAIRADYAGFRQNRLASSAAFLQVGQWILKLRVSGPEARRADVERTMDALLRDLRFEGRLRPIAAAPVAAEGCRRPPGPAARTVPTDDAETMEDAIMAHSLAGEVVADGQTDEPAPLPGGPRWCRSETTGAIPILRAANTTTGDDTRQPVLIVLLTDSGTMLEVAQRRFRNRTRFVLMHHQIGRTMVLGAYDGVPTDAQLQDIASGADRGGGRARATILYQAGGDSSVTVHVQSAPARPST